MAEEKTAGAVPNTGNAGSSSSEAVDSNVHSFVAGSEEWKQHARDAVEIIYYDDGRPDVFYFPDGSSFDRDPDKFPKNNGYNPLYFTSRGEIRLVSEDERGLLRRVLPGISLEDVVYRSDYLTLLDYVNNNLRDTDGKLVVKGDRKLYSSINPAELTLKTVKAVRDKELGRLGLGDSKWFYDSVEDMRRQRMAEVPVNDPRFGSDEWNAHKLGQVRIWTGMDRLGSTYRFPDGETLKRDLNLWRTTNGYNPAVFTLDGEVRLTTPEELRYLQRLNPTVKPENVAYRKDFVRYMDFELGILRDSNGKLIDARPGAMRGRFDEIKNYGMSSADAKLAAREEIDKAAELAEALADNDAKMSRFILRTPTGQTIGYHGKIDDDREWETERNRELALDARRMYPDNEDTRQAMLSLGSDESLGLLIKNFNEEYLAERYLVERLADHYDALGDFYKEQVDRADIFLTDISSVAARDALKGIYCRETLVKEAGYELEDLCSMSTGEVVELFEKELELGKINVFKGGNLDMAMYKASQKQCDYINKNYDTMYLPEAFREKYSHTDVALDALKADDNARKMEYRDAKEAFAFNALMIHLKPYVTEKALEKIATPRDAYRECMKYYEKIDINANPSVFEGGKVNREQAKELKAHGEDPKSFKTYEEAKAKIDTYEPTAEQVRQAKKFMKEEDIEKLNRGELSAAIRENRKAYAQYMSSEVTPEVRKIAENAGLVKPGESYTNEAWSKDSYKVQPSRQQLAYIHKNALEDTVEWYAKSQAERGNKRFLDDKGEVSHSAALYQAVQAFSERKQAEKGNGPMDKGQIAYFKNHNLEVSESMTWSQAQRVLVSQMYLDRLVGASNHRFMLDTDKHPNGIPGIDTEKLFRYDMNDMERAEVRKMVADACNEQRVKDRLAAIEGVDITDRSVYGSARNFACDYMEAHKRQKDPLEGVEAAMASAYARGEITFPDQNMVAEKGVPAVAVGHVMATVLPSGVKYNESLDKFTAMYQDAEKAYAAEKGAADKGKGAKKGKESEGHEG